MIILISIIIVFIIIIIIGLENTLNYFPSTKLSTLKSRKHAPPPPAKLIWSKPSRATRVYQFVNLKSIFIKFNLNRNLKCIFRIIDLIRLHFLPSIYLDQFWENRLESANAYKTKSILQNSDLFRMTSRH